MNTETYQNKNITTAGDSDSKTDGMNMGKNNTYQRPFFIVASSLLALLVLVALVGASGGQHLQSSEYEITKGAVALADYQVDSSNLALTNDIFSLGALSQNDVGKI